MKIERIYIENLFSYDKLELNLNKDLTIIVGPNNTGKTNLIRVLELLKQIIHSLLLMTPSSSLIRNIPSFLHNPGDKNARIEVVVKFDKKDKELMRRFFECYFSKFLEQINSGLGSNKFVLDIFEGKGEIKVSKGSYEKVTLNQCANTIFKESLEKFIKALPSFLSKGVFTWSYEGEYDKLPQLRFRANFSLKKNDLYEKLKENKISTEIVPFVFSTDEIEINIDITENNMFISYSGSDSPRNPSPLINALKREYTDFIREYKQSKIKEMLEFIVEPNHYVPPELLLLFLSKYKKLRLPELRKTEITESKKVVGKELFDYMGYEFNEGRILLLNELLLAIFDNAIIKLEEIRGLPEFKYSKDKTITDYSGNGRDLARYLFQLKNSREREDRDKYNKIISLLKQTFSNSNLPIENLDAVLDEKKDTLDVLITIGDREYSLSQVASGIFEVLNLLSVIIGAKEKIILLDEPALHLHPIYQKRVLELLTKEIGSASSEKDIKNQILIVTHSPYFINSENLEKTYRFYLTKNANNWTTKSVSLKEVVNSIKKGLIKFEENESLIRSLFANGVILVEGLSEYITVPHILKKLGYPPEDYNIEVINVGGKNRFEDFMKVMKELGIPFMVVCDGDTAFNVYDENSKQKKNLPIIFKALKEINILQEEDLQNLLNITSEFPERCNEKTEVVNYMKEIYEKFHNILIEKYGIFSCPTWDWNDFLMEELRETKERLKKELKNKGKLEKVWILINEATKEEIERSTRVLELKGTFESFIKTINRSNQS